MFGNLVAGRGQAVGLPPGATASALMYEDDLPIKTMIPLKKKGASTGEGRGHPPAETSNALPGRASA